MFSPGQSDDYRPLFWLSGRPIYVNTLILILNVLAFALLAFVGSLVSAFDLGNYEVVHLGQVWRLVTYVVFAPTTSWAAINFIFAMGFLFYFGKQVEEFVGRTTYATFYGALVLIPSILYCLLGLAFGMWGEGWLGGYGTIFGVFVAFATIYPGAEVNIWFVNLSAKYWALALLAVLSLVAIHGTDWVGLGALWCDAGIGYLGMRFIGAGYGFTWLTDWLDDRRTQRLAKQRNIKVHKETKVVESIDQILEKISKEGVGSLSASERAALERARTNLLKRDQR